MFPWLLLRGIGFETLQSYTFVRRFSTRYSLGGAILRLAVCTAFKCCVCNCRCLGKLGSCGLQWTSPEGLAIFEVAMVTIRECSTDE